MDDYFKKYLSDVEWLFPEDKYDPELQNTQESLLALGNGYLGSRSIYEENPSGSLAGTFFAGIFDEVASNVAELINAPNPFHLSISTRDNKLDLSTMPFDHHKRVLDLRKGLLVRHTVFKNNDERIDYQSMRFVSQHNIHVAAMQVVLTPLNKTTEFVVDCSIDTSVKNHGIILEQDTQNFNLYTLKKNQNLLYLSVESLDRQKEIAYGQEVFITINDKHTSLSDDQFYLKLKKGQTAVITKLITFFSAKNISDREKLISNVLATSQAASKQGFEQLVEDHTDALEKRWQYFDIEIAGDIEVQSGLRLNLYHLLIAKNVAVKDVSIGARLLTGEGYKGHVFWETELLILPSYLFSDPLLARQLLEYRFNRLSMAKKIARNRGYRGALFPWESADSGLDETPAWSLDLDGTIKIVHTGKQALHINVAIFYAIYQYFFATKDVEFMLTMGITMIIDLARFWKSRVIHNKKKNLYKIKDVMGPDEFHEYIDNNAYTNKLVAWSFEKTLELIEKFQREYPEETNKILKLQKFYPREKIKMQKISRHMWVPLQDEIILQFDKYLKLKNIRTPKLDIYGLPSFPPDLLIINLYRTQLIKQADVILLLLLLQNDYDHKTIETNFQFYEGRTLHKSSWSPPIYSAVAAQLTNVECAYHYLNITLNTDKKNIYGNTAEGMHTPSVGGAWVAMMYGFCGVRVMEDRLVVKPNLPVTWQAVSFKVAYLDFILNFSITRQEVKVIMEETVRPWLSSQPLRQSFATARLQIGDKVVELFPSREYLFPIESNV